MKLTPYFQKAIHSPYFHFACVPTYRQRNIPSELLVLSLDSRISFPFEYSVRSFRALNKGVKTVLLFLTVADANAPTELAHNERYLSMFKELEGLEVYIVLCQPSANHEYPVMGPKSCVYYAPLLLAAETYLWLDLDTISVEGIERHLLASKKDKIFYYVPEDVSSHPNNLFYHCLRAGGIYNGYIGEHAEYGFNEFTTALDKEQAIVNTGVMFASAFAATDVAHTLYRMMEKQGKLAVWTHAESQTPNAFTGHREQAIFDLALRESLVPCALMSESFNFQTLKKEPTIWNHSDREFLRCNKSHSNTVAILHFNGYHNVDSPSRRCLENLIANSKSIRQLCGIEHKA